jgi:hypothetical protein
MEYAQLQQKVLYRNNSSKQYKHQHLLIRLEIYAYRFRIHSLIQCLELAKMVTRLYQPCQHFSSG